MREIINNTPQDSGLGDSLFVAFNKVNAMTLELYNQDASFSGELQTISAIVDTINDGVSTLNHKHTLDQIIGLQIALSGKVSTSTFNTQIAAINASIVQINSTISDIIDELQTKVDEAPFSGITYGRNDGEWVPIQDFTGGTVSGATNFTGGLTATTISATTYQNLPIPTLQQVQDFNHDLVNGVFNAGTDAGDFNTGVNQVAIGQEAGIYNEGDNQNALGGLAGAGNTGDNQNAMGYNAGLNNQGVNQNAFGNQAGAEQRGDNHNAFGESAGYDNSGDDQNALGYKAGYANQGLNQNAFGLGAGENNTGISQNAFGEGAGANNTGDNVNAFGNGAGIDNTFNNVNLFGIGANATADGQTVLAKNKNTMARINTSGLTDSREYDLQDKSGTIAHLDDIPTNTSQLVNDGEDGSSPYVTLDQLPSNLSLFATNVSSDIGGYFKLVTSIDDPDYNTTPVDIPTGAITTTGQFIASLATSAGVLIGNPGIINLTTIGNIQRVAGTGTAEFYYEVYHRNSGGTETLVATSNATAPITVDVYTEFLASALLNNGTFLETDRIVVKYYADRIIGDSDPSYEFQFGGTSPVRTTFPVPASNLPFSLDTLSDVNISGATSGDILVYNDTSDEWENQSPNFIEKSVGPTYTTNSLITVTQAEYDAIITKDDTKIYFIV